MMPLTLAPQGHRPTEAETRARKMRNRALGLALLAIVGLFWVVTMAKIAHVGLH